MLLNGCVAAQIAAQQTPTGPRLGSDDGTDACRSQAEQFDSTAAYFAAPIVAGAVVIGAGGILGTRPGVIGALVWAASSAAAAAAATSYLEQRQRDTNNDPNALAAAMATDLDQENAHIAQSQQTLDAVTDCRLREAQRVQAAAQAGEIQRREAEQRLAALRQQAERDLTISQGVQQRIQARAAEMDPGFDTVAPGARAAPPPRPQPVVTRPRQAVALQAAPLPSAPPVATPVAASQPVQVVPTRNPDFVAVETPSGQRLGYARAATFSIPPSQTRAVSVPAVAGAADAARLRTLVGTNIARREGFSESVADLQRAVSSGFELGT
ncbi:hypothetical protein [Roseomonas alba]|nr:hypothetical protein [Neoroseomonas alba]